MPSLGPHPDATSRGRREGWRAQRGRPGASCSISWCSKERGEGLMVHGTAEHMGQRWSAGSRRRVRERSQSAAAMRWNSPIRNTGKEGGAREGDVGGSIWIPHHGGGRTMAHATMVSVSRCGKRALGPVGKCRYHIPNRLGRPSTSASPESGDSFISSLQRSSIFVATRFLRRRHSAPRRLAGARRESPHRAPPRLRSHVLEARVWRVCARLGG